jgi:hypothetical protein
LEGDAVMFKLISSYRAFMRLFNGRGKCDCRYNLGSCEKVIKVSGNGVISIEGQYKCAKFTDKIKLTARQAEKAITNPLQ